MNKVTLKKITDYPQELQDYWNSLKGQTKVDIHPDREMARRRKKKK